MVTTGDKKYDEITLFFETFVGELVEVTTHTNIKSSMETEEGTLLQEIPLTIKGFLLDQDEEFYYLGNGPGSVETAVAKPIVAITIVKQKTPFDELLDDMPDPDNEEEMN